MIYSRWFNSYWYTYWQVPSDGEIENVDTAKLCICTLADTDWVFTAKELREKRDKCLKQVVKQDSVASVKELKELNVYMDQFVADVDEKYKKG